MRIIPDAQLEWALYTALYPLFKQALPQISRLSDADQKDLDVKNAITTIRSSMFKIHDQLQQDQLKQELKEHDFCRFLKVLQSLLGVFEGLVGEEVQKQPESSPSKYPKLTILKNRLQTPESITISLEGDFGSPQRKNEDWPISAKYSTDLLLKQARHIKFHGPKRPDFCAIAEKLISFVSTVADIFNASLGALDDIRDNATLLRDDEIEFVKRAHGMNDLSKSLFTYLTSSLTCRKAHTAMMHLSGFLDTEFNLELLITACTEQSWYFTNCRWITKPPLERNIASHVFCSQSQNGNPAPRKIQLAFNHESMWDDTGPEISAGSIPVPAASSPLWKLAVPGISGSPISTFESCKFDSEDRKIVELLLACSLLHLNTSHWLQAGWETDSILIYAGQPNAEDPLKRWRPFIACSLESSSYPIVEHEDIQDVLSFGLLIMEMEAELKVLPTDEDKDWETGLPSKDSMLKRVLTDSKWRGKVEDGYKRIVKACLEFRDHVDKFYDPDLPENMKRTAALYRYILAPLHELITQRFSSASLCSNGFPDPSESSSSPYDRGLSQNSGSGLVLFDDFGSGSAWHHPDNISWASAFMKNITPFVDKIRDLEYTCKQISASAVWRHERIRIAIIDTGIDDEDILIESARDERRIKDCNCRGFVKDAGDYQDYHGHGTRVVRLLLELAPSAELYIAKISDDKSIELKNLSRISEAIKWACKNKVHMVSMSFGLEKRDRDIDKAISIAFKQGITMFAAAANDGGNRPRAYPSNKHGSVICVHASDGLGNVGKISPSPVKKEDNFSTLGISIQSKWKEAPVTMSGTSFATPIAVALAANVLEFARYKCLLDEYEQQCLYQFNGVRKILQLMSDERDGYDYITPLHLWKSKSCNNKSEDDKIAREITDIARSP